MPDMGEQNRRIAVYPGGFDPPTNGHLDVIERGRRLFDELVVVVGHNPAKRSLFTPAQRVAMLGELTAEMPNVRVDTFEGLTVDYVRHVGAATILRGIRNAADLHFEFELAFTNRKVADVETVFIMTRGEYAFTSSSLIKQVADMGGDVSTLVPPLVARKLRPKG